MKWYSLERFHNYLEFSCSYFIKTLSEFCTLSPEAMIFHDMLSAPMESLEGLAIIFWEIIPKVAAG